LRILKVFRFVGGLPIRIKSSPASQKNPFSSFFGITVYS